MIHSSVLSFATQPTVCKHSLSLSPLFRYSHLSEGHFAGLSWSVWCLSPELLHSPIIAAECFETMKQTLRK